jgi:hypothetical protein
MKLAARSLGSLAGSRLPRAESLDQLEQFIRLRVGELSERASTRRFMALRTAILSAPLIGACVAGLISYLQDHDPAKVGTAAGVTALLSSFLPVLFAISDGSRIFEDLAREAARTTGRLTGEDLLGPFGGSRAVPMALLKASLRPTWRPVPNSIPSAVVWELSQLTDRQHQFLFLNASSECTLGELLDAYARCSPYDEAVE